MVSVVSWNACKINPGESIDIVNSMCSKVLRGIICLQEVASWDDAMVLPGWTTVSEHANPTAVLVPLELDATIRRTEFNEISTAVVMDSVAVISAYLADSGKTIGKYEETVGQLRCMLQKLWKDGVRYFII